ncbi:ATP-binding protein [Nocardia kruczakiae]|uniref:ATP-binding protein n=1 Tax=Nocardia kruczakiae TaxID=261477 RepID=UPI0007A44882|nr:AAA family ATPase [Nocardia kruczakiae]
MAPLRVGTVPTTSDEFIGREPELGRLATLLSGSARLITVIGAGGLGKTRLVTEAVHRLPRTGGRGVHWVRLARLAAGTDAAGVAEEVVRAVVDHDFSGRDPWPALSDTLAAAAAPPVLVMDNCEHVTEGAGQVIAELIETVPDLTVLATSRRPLGWIDEQLLPLPPLTQAQAVELFHKRAALTGTVLSPDSAGTVASICRHLHHYPLHIRLAAARLRRRPPAMILRDLDGRAGDTRLHWPPTTLVGADTRHRGITDVIAWSFELCDARERLLFERMSVFAPGYDVNPADADDESGLEVGADLDAIVAVCSGLDASHGSPAEPAAAEIEELLERLADQSLVTVHLSAREVRYSLLESLRLFARERLAERDPREPRRLADRHRRYYRDRITGSDDGDGRLPQWARASWDNLLIAIDRSLDSPDDAVAGLEIALGMIALHVPFFRGSLRESRRRAEKTLAVADSAPEPLRIRAMATIAWICLCQGQPGEAAELLDRCVAAAVPEPAARARLAADPTADVPLPAPVVFTLGCRLMLVDQDVRALVLLSRAREMFTTAADYGHAAICALFEALAAAFLGTPEQALAVTARHLEAAESGADWAKSWAEIARIIAETLHGDARWAAAAAPATLARQVATRDTWGVVWSVHARAWALARLTLDAPPAAVPRATAVEIARLLGAAAALRRRLGVEIAQLRPFVAETDRAADGIRRLLGAHTFDAAYREGTEVRPTLTEISRLACDIAAPDERPARPHAPEWDLLTRAEQEVAALAAAGWTNGDIAARRGSSTRTVDAQVAAVLRKLAVASRADIAPQVPPERRTRAEHTPRPRGCRTESAASASSVTRVSARRREPRRGPRR